MLEWISQEESEVLWFKASPSGSRAPFIARVLGLHDQNLRKIVTEGRGIIEEGHGQGKKRK